MLDLCYKKTRTGKSHDYRDFIVLEKSVFKMSAFSNSFYLTEERFLFCFDDGLARRVDSNCRNKAAFASTMPALDVQIYGVKDYACCLGKG